MTVQNEGACILLTLALLVASLWPTAFPRLNGRWSLRVQTKAWWAANLLVGALLLFVLNPEVRLWLVYIEFIGVDVVLMLVAFQLRYYLAAVSPFAAGSLVARLFGLQLLQLLPRIAPSLRVIRLSPRLALYVLLLPVAMFGIRSWEMITVRRP
jgi:hypothetical protein